MTKNLHETPSVSCNPELSACPPFCDTSSSNSVPPQYCISGKHSGDCLSCNLSSGGVDCQGNEIFLSWDEPQAEPVDEDPDHPAYCSQNHGDCSSSLVNYGRDCMNNPVSDREVING